MWLLPLGAKLWLVNPIWLPPIGAKRLVGLRSTRCDAAIAPVVPPNWYHASNPRSQSSQRCCGSPTSRASRHARAVGGFGTVLPRRVVAVMSSRDCTSRSGLATNGSVAMVLVGKKSTMAARTSSRDQSASSGEGRPGAALLADMMGLSSVLAYLGSYTPGRREAPERLPRGPSKD